MRKPDADILQALSAEQEGSFGLGVQIRTLPRLSRDGEALLLSRWRERHDPGAARLLVAGNLFLVIETVQRLRGAGLMSNELIGEGFVGLMQALCRYDPMSGTRFGPYARQMIGEAIGSFLDLQGDELM